MQPSLPKQQTLPKLQFRPKQQFQPMQQSLLIGLGLFAAVLLQMPNALAARYKIVGQKLIAPGYWKVMVRYAWKNGPVDTDVYEVNCKTRNATYKGMNRLPMGDEESLIKKVCNW